MARRVRLLIKTPWADAVPEPAGRAAEIEAEIGELLDALEPEERARVLASLVLERLDARIWT